MTKQAVLAISGNDIFSGGGLNADIATFTINGLRSFLVVSCLTAVTEAGFEVFPTTVDLFAKQLHSLSDVPFSVIKLGLLPSPELVEVVLDFLKKRPTSQIVFDPVWALKETGDAEVAPLRESLLALLPYASVVTPNLVEAERLSQQPIKTVEEMKLAAKWLADQGAKSVLIKGGKRLGLDKAVDVFYDGQDYHVLESPLLNCNNTGAGCTLAASITSGLAKGLSLLEAVQAAKTFVQAAIQQSDAYGVVQT